MPHTTNIPGQKVWQGNYSAFVPVLATEQSSKMHFWLPASSVCKSLSGNLAINEELPRGRTPA